MELSRSYSVFLFWIIVIVTVIEVQCTHVVNITLGSVIGSLEEVVLQGDDGSTTTAECARYLGIPYAEPPVGDLRFRKPVERRPWSSPHDGTQTGARCYYGGSGVPSEPVSTRPAPVSEECLTLDIYAPPGSLNSSKYAVMVFMPSDSGSSHNYPGDQLSVFGDIVYVVVNFRTGILGYLSLGNEAIPGNFGLWDQQLALKWVNNHIAAFGGDPQRVSLISFGVGASRTVLQALYPENHGLFHRLIVHSGSPIPVHHTSAVLQPARGSEMAAALGCARQTSEDTAKCMRSLSLSDLNARMSQLKQSFPLTPVIDNDFIIDAPLNVLTKLDSRFTRARTMFSSVQLLTGITNMEGGTLVGLMWVELLHQELNNFNVNRTVFDGTVVPFAIELVFGKNISQSIIRTTAFQYTDATDPYNETKIRDSVVQLSTDLDTGTPVVKLARLHAQNSRLGTYLYQFSAKLGITNQLAPGWLSGATYGDDIYYLLGFSNLKVWEHTADYVPTRADIRTSNRLMTMWSNFVKTGDPNRHSQQISDGSLWLPYEPEESPYVDIGFHDVTFNYHFREPYMRFWTSIIPALLEDISSRTNTEGSEAEDATKEESFNYHSKFNVTLWTADNIIIALIVASSSLLLGVFLMCFIAMSRGTVFRYNVKVV